MSSSLYDFKSPCPFCSHVQSVNEATSRMPYRASSKCVKCGEKIVFLLPLFALSYPQLSWGKPRKEMYVHARSQA